MTTSTASTTTTTTMATTTATTTQGPGGTRPADPAEAATGPGVLWRYRGWYVALLAAVLLTVLGLAVTWLRPTTSDDFLAPDSPRPDGAMALAQLLRAEGIEVTKASSVPEAVEQSYSGATIALIYPELLSRHELRSLAGAGADVVVLEGAYGDDTTYDPAEDDPAEDAAEDAVKELTRIRRDEALTSEGAVTLEPACADEDALAAQSLTVSADYPFSPLDLSSAPDAQGCFPLAQGGYAYATEPLDGGGTLRFLASPSVLTNDNLAEAGNAALALRATGHAQRVVWLDASLTVSLWDNPSLPPGLPVLGLELVLVVVVLALVRGRRFGPVVTERLPVVVRSTETTTARGRLYRRGADRARAGDALRAGTAMRLGRVLGLPPGARRQDLLDALSSTTSIDRAQVEAMLYGPPPPSDSALAILAVQLDHLESEVRSR